MSIPYSEVKRRGQINEKILQELSQSINTVEDLDLEKAEKLGVAVIDEGELQRLCEG